MVTTNFAWRTAVFCPCPCKVKEQCPKQNSSTNWLLCNWWSYEGSKEVTSSCKWSLF